MAAVQGLVIKRFKRTRSDILYEDDENCMKLLTNLLQQYKNEDETSGAAAKANF